MGTIPTPRTGVREETELRITHHMSEAFECVFFMGRVARRKCFNSCMQMFKCIVKETAARKGRLCFYFALGLTRGRTMGGWCMITAVASWGGSLRISVFKTGILFLFRVGHEKGVVVGSLS